MPKPSLWHSLARRAMGLMVFLLLLVTPAISHAGIDTGLFGDDRAAGPFPVGFSFNYYGQTFTQFYVTTNGLVQFSGPTTAYSNSCLPAYGNTLYVFWDDLRTDVAGQPTGTIKYQTIGEAPNRKLIVQWTNQYFYGENLPMGTFEAILSEGSDEIKYQYRNLIGARSLGNSATIGLQGASTTAPVGCNQTVLHEGQAITFVPDATRSTYAVDPAANYNFIDISGLTPEPPRPTARYMNQAPTWSWYPIQDLNAYQVEVQTLAGQVVHTQTLGNVSSFRLDSGFAEAETYLLRVRGSINGGATWELWSGLSDPVTIDQIRPTMELLSSRQSGPQTVDYSFRATDATSGPNTIRVVLANDPDFATPVLDTTIAGTSTSYRYTQAAPGQHLYARMQVTDRASNLSDYTAVADVEVFPAPTAAFEASPTSGEAPLNVALNNTSTGNISGYLWEFGNGQTSNAATPTARYTQPGTYTIALRTSGIGGATDASTVVTVTPDITLPAISSFSVDGIELIDSYNVPGEKQFDVNVGDASGLESIVATLAGEAIALLDLGGGHFRIALDPLAYPNGDYTLAILAKDIFGNESSRQQALKIELPPPVPPTITAPAAGFKTNQTSIDVTGTTELGKEVQLLVNGVPQGEWVAVLNKHFTAPAALVEGANTIAAVVRNVRGSSQASAARQVTLDTSKPAAPQALAATALPAGKIRLSWGVASDPAATAFELYSATTEFTAISQARKVARLPLSTRTYEEVPPAEGQTFYRLVTVNALGTTSVPSNQVMAVSDRTLPVAERIAYTPQGAFDADTGTFGQGRMDISVTVSEALMGAPYLSLVPEGGMPIPVDLIKRDDLHYEGSVNLGADAGAGLVTTLFSARDLINNRGTEVRDGATLRIDTQGPVVKTLAVAPQAPIKVDANRQVTATLGYDEPSATGIAPALSYQLSGSGRMAVPIADVSRIDDRTWQARFDLPADAGLTSPEQLVFIHATRDALGNVSTRIAAGNTFQVYQGELPALEVPMGIKGTALPGGKVLLEWQGVPDVSAYQIYRQAPGETALVALTRSTEANVTDSTPVDGIYRYSVASVRAFNGQESVSGQSPVAEVRASRVAPGAPQNLSLELTPQGVLARWQPPVGAAPASYRLYRSAAGSITTVEGLTPLKQNIKLAQAMDAVPSQSEHAYVVTALDTAGNESAISNSAYLNFSLLPVKVLQVEQIGEALPVLTWAPNGTGTVGYDVFVGSGDNRVKLTPSPTTAKTLTDTGFTGGERRYTVETVDANDVRMPRSIVLPNASMQLVSGTPLKRNVMNRLNVQVSNPSADPLSAAQVVVRIADREFRSESFELGANGTRLVPVVIGGYPDIPNPARLTVMLENSASEGELARLGWAQDVEVVDSALVVGMEAENFTRGASGNVRLTVENTSDVEVELLTARNFGREASNELRLKLLDNDGNLLSATPYLQATGAGVITLANGQTVARIAPGQRYVSDVFRMPVPVGAPDQVKLKLEADKLRYSTGQPEEIAIPGMGSERAVALIETPYYGEIASIDPVVSYGTSDVVILGRAVDRSSGGGVANAPLKIAFNQEGFERLADVTTNADGSFRYVFKPTVTDSGQYRVGAVHPDMTDRPDQGRFTVNRVNLSPATFKLTVPRNYPYRIDYRATTGTGSQLNNVRVAYLPEYQPSGSLLPGIKVEPGAPINIAPRQNLALPVSISGDNSAARFGQLVLAVVADGSGATPLALLQVNYELTEAKPALYPSRDFVETGLARGNTVIEQVVLENKGFTAASDVAVQLVAKDGSPLPSWVTIASNPAIGAIGIGEKRTIDLNIAPPAGTAEGIYQLNLRFAGSNVPAADLGIAVSVTESGQGSVEFHVSDIYTGTFDANSNPIPGLKGARIYLQNEAVISQTYEFVTDELGQALFLNIPAGTYRFKASAQTHQEATGRLSIKPGVVGHQSVFLEYTLISVEWSVREITIEDRYEITLNATFETDVPAPVVVLQPTSINLPKMTAGQVFQGELILTNYGLLRADNLQTQFPTSDEFFKFEFLAQPPTSLQAKQRVRLPYRVIALRSFGSAETAPQTLAMSASAAAAEETSASGPSMQKASSDVSAPATANATASSGGTPGCFTYSNRLRQTCQYTCANGQESTNCGSSANWFYVESWGCPVGGTPIGGSGGAGGGGWGGGSGGGYSPMPGLPLCTKGSGDCFEPKNKQSSSGNEGGQ
ncbi:hypothetical protein GCM10027159_10520 [Lysobacter terrae]